MEMITKVHSKIPLKVRYYHDLIFLEGEQEETKEEKPSAIVKNLDDSIKTQNMLKRTVEPNPILSI